MLAEPESFSPPDEVCCWPGRRDRDVAAGSAVAELLTCRGAMAELLLARELQRSSIGKLVLAGALWRKQLAKTAGSSSKPAIAI